MRTRRTKTSAVHKHSKYIQMCLNNSAALWQLRERLYTMHSNTCARQACSQSSRTSNTKKKSFKIKEHLYYWIASTKATQPTRKFLWTERRQATRCNNAKRNSTRFVREVLERLAQTLLMTNAGKKTYKSKFCLHSDANSSAQWQPGNLFKKSFILAVGNFLSKKANTYFKKASTHITGHHRITCCLLKANF